jgi:group II intron reverse transcriptase/maturase
MGTQLQWIAERALDPEYVFTTLAHRLDEALLRHAYALTRKSGAPGVDGETAEEYGADLDRNLKGLHERLRRGQYRAPHVRRAWIPKAKGERRPIGVPTFEDKVVQRAVLLLLEPIYEADFYDFSYGFRRGRRAHDALKALRDAVMEGGIRWIVDADIEGFFDHLDHGTLRELLRKRVNDRGILRLIGRWLKAGILEGDLLSHPDRGTPQGGVISPLLANLYLHHVLDVWFSEVVRPRLRGRAVLIRFGDDFVVGFEFEADARRFLEVLPKRLARFELSLHPEKTRLIEFAPRRGATFDFLGFTHYWGKSRKGFWVVKRRTSRKRLARFLRDLNRWCRWNRHAPIEWQYELLCRKLRGHYGYYSVRCNMRSLEVVHDQARETWRKWLCRRSQKARMGWDRYAARMERFVLPPPRILHAWV